MTEWLQYLEKFFGMLKGMWRYRWYGLCAAWVIAVVGWVAIAMLPDRYQAKASVYIETDSLIKPLLKNITVTQDTNQRVQHSIRTLLKRNNVEKIAKMADLDLNVKTQKAHDSLVDKLEYDIKIVRDGRSNLFNIKYEHRSPQQAKLVVQSVLNLFIEATLSDKRTDTSIAKKFLTEQISHYETKLVESEQRLAKFKRDNIGTLPHQEQSYYESLQKILNDKEQVTLELAVAEGRKLELEKQLRGELPSHGLMDFPSEGNQGSELPGSRKIATLKGYLGQLKVSYTDEHPAVKRLKNRIDHISITGEDFEMDGHPHESEHYLEQNPVYQQMKIALSEASAHVAEVNARLNELNDVAADLQKKVDQVIEAETTLANLNRDYLIYKNHYHKLLEKREAAKMAESLDNTTGTIDFRVVNPPFVPSLPSGPNRFVYSTLVLLIAASAGLFISFIRSQLSAAFYEKISIKQQLGLKILATVPNVAEDNKTIQKRNIKIFSLSFGLLLIVYTFFNILYLI